MTFFLFAKQLVDMLYQYQILDYFMVIMVFLLLLYQIALVRPDFRKRFMLTDGIVFLLAALLTVNFLRSGSGYQDYFKVMSAFLIYFVGRIYYDRIKECYGALVLSAYLVVYLNLFERIWRFGGKLFQVTNAEGDFYFYDTDMAFAMILAMVFIAMFDRNSLHKLFTVFIVCPYMVFYSDAGIQMILMIVVYAILAVYLVELVFRNKQAAGILLSVMIAGLLIVVAVIYLPVLGFDNPELIASLFKSRFLNSTSMYIRYADWNRILDGCREQGIFAQLFGMGSVSGISINSLYLKIFYTLGFVGLFLALLLVISIMYHVTKVEDRKTFYLAVIMAVLLMGSGVTVNSMEFTQMSWFPLLFSGMVISSVQMDMEKKTDILGIITGTIKPAPQMGLLTVRDEKERLGQYEEGLKSILDSGAFAKVVFCENSNYGIEELAHLTEIAKEKGVELELLPFQGDTQQSCLHGKGYGEGEIMEYVFSHSRLLTEETYFVKITGRLKVDNLHGIVSRMKKQKTYFNIPNRTIRDIYDTRIYGMSAKQFKDHFLHAYGQVMDEEGTFLEMVYTRILKEQGIKVFNFPRYPRITGISGSGGAVYAYAEWKCRIRDVFSRMNLYRVKKS